MAETNLLILVSILSLCTINLVQSFYVFPQYCPIYCAENAKRDCPDIVLNCQPGERILKTGVCRCCQTCSRPFPGTRRGP